jgi:uncharacterized membrane protein
VLLKWILLAGLGFALPLWEAPHVSAMSALSDAMAGEVERAGRARGAGPGRGARHRCAGSRARWHRGHPSLASTQLDRTQAAEKCYRHDRAHERCKTHAIAAIGGLMHKMIRQLMLATGFAGLLGSASAQPTDDFVYTTLDVGAASQVEAYGINNRGQIVGGYWDAFGRFGFVLHDARIAQIKAPAPYSVARALGINDRGDVVGEYEAEGVVAAFLRKGDRTTALNIPSLNYASAAGVNNRGDIVGYYNDVHQIRAFVMSDSGFAGFDAPASLATYATGVNDHGQVVGYYLDASFITRAFIKDGARFVSFDCPGANITVAAGINNAGRVVGFYWDAAGQHGFVREDDRCIRLEVPGALGTAARGINDRGRIVGYYYDGSTYRGFVAESLSGSLCARHSMTTRSMYAEQDRDDQQDHGQERGHCRQERGAAQDPQGRP